MTKTSLLLLSLFSSVAFGDGPADAPKSVPVPIPAPSFREKISERKSDVNACYQHYLDNGLSDRGVVVVKWKIDDHGMPFDITVDKLESTLKEKILSDCLVDIVKSLRFPEAPKGKSNAVSFRFTFEGEI